MVTMVIGAGIAGLSAAHDLMAAGESVTVLEARGRIGGRVFTNHDFANFPVEFGAEFIHGDEAPTWLLVRELGLRTLHWHRTDDSLFRLTDGSLCLMQDAPHDIGRLWELDAAALTQDESLRAYLIRQGFDASQVRYADRTFVNAVGERIEEVSALAALAEIHETSNGSGDFRILDGYDRLIAHLAQGLDIRLDTPVNRIEWSAAGVKVHTTADVYEAQQVIITLPLGVLQSGTITFTPELPAHKLEAIHHLRMGPGLKMLYRFAEPILPPTVSALFSDCVPPMWWSPSFGQSTEQTVWTAFATGDWARQLLALGEAGALAQGLETLRYELGRPDLQPEAMRMMNWVDEPYTRGAYSVATPGFADVRDQIATPLDGVLYWAGEHTASHGNAATVHGAYTSGQRAAQEVLNRAR